MSATFAPSVDMIIRQSLQLAGLLPLGREPSGIELRHARDMFDVTLKSLSTRGAALDQLERVEMTLSSPATGSRSSLAMDADTIEVNFPMMLKLSGQDSETPVSPMVFREYQALSNKLSTGTPTSCYVEKLSTVTLYFWPVPIQTYTVSFQRQRLIADSASGSAPDLRGRWYEALTYSMSHKMILAASLGVEQARNMKGLADEAIMYALGREQEQGDLTFELPRL